MERLVTKGARLGTGFAHTIRPGCQMVYVVGLFDRDRQVLPLCKIGITSDPARRFVSLSTNSPFEPFYYWWFDMRTRAAALSLEQRMHEKFAPHRGNGEWFHIRPAFAAGTIISFLEGATWATSLRIR